MAIRKAPIKVDYDYPEGATPLDPNELEGLKFKHMLVYIHLFPNGNGRHARIMADALLTKTLKMEPLNWLGGFDLQKMNEGRKEYILALRAADKGNIKPLIYYVKARKIITFKT